MSLWKVLASAMLAVALAFVACGEDEPTIPEDPDDIPTPQSDDLELVPDDDGEEPLDVTIPEIVDTLVARGVEEERATCLAEVVLRDMGDGQFTPHELREWYEDQPEDSPVEDSLQSQEAREECPE